MSRRGDNLPVGFALGPETLPPLVRPIRPAVSCVFVPKIPALEGGSSGLSERCVDLAECGDGLLRRGVGDVVRISGTTTSLSARRCLTGDADRAGSGSLLAP